MTAVPVDVAVGVLIRADGRFLLAQRPEGKPMAGYWEFPGGKVEAGESVLDALIREFDEELGLKIIDAHPWAQRVVVYPHATVRLHFWRSFGEWEGEPESREGQEFRWERIDALTTEPWLPGALPVKRWLQLPAVYAISNAVGMGVDLFLDRLDARLAIGTIHQLQLREPGMDQEIFAALFEDVWARCSGNGVRLLVNSRHPRAYWTRADGVHLTSRDLAEVEVRPEAAWSMASCHDAEQLARAGALGLDAVVLGPVMETASHPGGAGIGWEGFGAMAGATMVPAYGIGGLGIADVPDAVRAGGQGIAAIRDVWIG